jgi:hypothetical protein
MKHTAHSPFSGGFTQTSLKETIGGHDVLMFWLENKR